MAAKQVKRSPLLTFDRIPPALCRFLARESIGRSKRFMRPMSHNRIAQRAGLDRDTVKSLSKLRSWENVRLDTIDRFSRACGVDLFQPGTHLTWLVKSAKGYLRNATPAQRLMLERCLERISRPAQQSPTTALPA